MFFGKYVGSDEFGNKYYKNKKTKDGLYMQKILKLQKLPLIGSFGYIILLTKYQQNLLKKFKWQKSHTQNLSGSSKAYKPNKISNENKFKNYETWKN